MSKYKHAVMGGTFDHLHAGHKVLLDAALELAEYVSIGVTSDQYVQKTDKNFKELIQSCGERIRNVQNYLIGCGHVHRAEVSEVDGTLGDTLKPEYDVFLASDEEGHLELAENVNKMREGRGLTRLAVEVIDARPQFTPPDGGRISSTRIRRYLKYHHGK